MCRPRLSGSPISPISTPGFRSQWGARTYADAVSVIATGRLHGRSAFHALRDALAGRPIHIPGKSGMSRFYPTPLLLGPPRWTAAVGQEEQLTLPKLSGRCGFG